MERTAVLKRGRQTNLRELTAAHLAALVDSSDDAIYSQTLDSIITSWNAAAERLYGHPAAEVIGRSVERFLPPERVEEERRIVALIRAGQRVRHFETVRLRRDGSEIHLSMSVSPILDARGVVIGAAKIARDISAERAERERVARLAALAHHLAAIVSSSGDAIVSKTLEGIVTSWNGAAARIFGYASEEMVGRSIRMLLPPERADEEDVILRKVNAGEHVGPYDTRRVRKDGSLVDVSLTVSPIRDEHGVIVGVSKIARDIGDRLEAERRIAHEAGHDGLTGLANRRQLNARLDAVLQQAQRQSNPLFAVLYIDLDGFKRVNDSLGHVAGDRLLMAVAGRLQAALRAEDFVARLGGDEFVVLADRLSSAQDAFELGARLVAVLRSAVVIDDTACQVSGSVGVALYPAHGRSCDELLRHADHALYRAKREGRDRVVVCEAADLSAA